MAHIIHLSYIFSKINMCKNCLFFIFFSLCSFSYAMEPKTSNNDTIKKRNPINFEGDYMDGSKNKGGWWMEVKIRKIDHDGEYSITVHSSKIKSMECCSFDKRGLVKNDTLFLTITDWQRPITAIITKNKNVITFDVIEKQPDDRYVLNWYCCGGASLMGSYKMVPLKTQNKENKLEIQNTAWSLVDIEQNGSSLPILLDFNSLRFNNENSFVANFCHEIKGNYNLSPDNRIMFSALSKRGKNHCKEISATPIQTQLPNISVAEEILMFGSFKAKRENDRLTLSNRKGKLIFKRLQKEL